MSGVVIHPVEGYSDEVHHVAKHMRQEDVEELWQLGRNEPEAALRQSMRATTEAFVVYRGGEPVGVMGAVLPVLGSHGVPWLLGTRGLDHCRREIVHYGKVYTEHLLTRCKMLENIALASNTKTLVFLKGIGFDISDPITLSTGVKAVVFRKEARHV